MGWEGGGGGGVRVVEWGIEGARCELRGGCVWLGIELIEDVVCWECF